SSSLLGRSAHGAAEMSEFRRRLAGRTYVTSLGPGGTSPELIALGTNTQPTNGQAANAAPDADDRPLLLDRGPVPGAPRGPGAARTGGPALDERRRLATDLV